jgi:hypothetical protein
MPLLSDKKPLLGRKDNYVERAPDWYRERLLVFVPAPTEGSKSTSHVEDALRTVVQVIEAPFLEKDSRIYAPMTHFVTRISVGGGANHTEHRIEKLVENLSRDLGIKFEPRVLQSTIPDDKKRNGFFMGTALYVPGLENGKLEKPRGSVSIFLYSPKTTDGEQTITEYSVQFASAGEKIPAGFYAGQDRLCFGVGRLLPAYLEHAQTHQFKSENAAPLEQEDSFEEGEDGLPSNIKEDAINMMLEQDAICMVLPPSGLSDQGNANVFFVKICDSAKGVALGSEISKTSNAALSMLEDKDDTWIMSRQHGADPATGVIEMDVSDGLVKLDRRREGHSAVLQIVPNAAYSRLRAVPDAIKGGRLEVLGVVLPSPSASDKVRECVINLTPQDQLLPHELEAHATSIVIQQKPYGIGGFRDMVSTASSRGTIWQDPRGLSNQSATRIGKSHLLQLISNTSRFDRTFNERQFLQAVFGLENRLRGNQFSLFTRLNSNSNLGWIGLPLPHEDPRPNWRHKASVSTLRSHSLGKMHQVCLDWLDTAVKVVVQERNDPQTLIGYADFWARESVHFPSKLSSLQSFEMRPHLTVESDQISRLNFVENTGGDPVYMQLKQGDCLNVGPLIVRYHTTGDTQ